jgi:DNA/RNA-binding domain of Phe-tRNA-synthetase-like protein
MVDLCNAASVAAAVPVAVFDRHAITTELVVRPAAGGEDYLTFSGEHENPDVDEVIYADTAGHAHARRWTNRQSARSATHPDTRAALIVVEALHEDGENTITTALNSITDALTNNGHPAPRQHVLSLQQPTIAW